MKKGRVYTDHNHNDYYYERIYIEFRYTRSYYCRVKKNTRVSILRFHT